VTENDSSRAATDTTSRPNGFTASGHTMKPA
jgi:hypothetical protein